MSRIILHIDLNAFFASAMQLKFPELKGKPIAVCGNNRGSVVTTASYEARAFGVSSAMPLAIAYQKCPDLRVVETDFEWFRTLSEKFIKLIKRFSAKVEQASIDECYVDVTDVMSLYAKPLNLVVEIQNQVKNELGLPCSIGVAPNKFLAKMASDMKKPMGISILRKREVKQKLWPLAIDEMMYVGKKTAVKLKAIGILTIADLAQASISELTPILGKQTHLIQGRAWGNDVEEVITDSDIKSISASQSLFEPIFEYDEVSLLVHSLVEDIAEKCEKQQVAGKTLTLHVKYEDSSSQTKSTRSDDGYSKPDQLYQLAMLLFDEIDEDEPIKFISLSLMNLKEVVFDEIYNLFTMHHINKIDDIIDTANGLLGKNVLMKANQLQGKGNED